MRAHLAGADDAVVVVAPALQRYPDFAGLLAETPDAAAFKALRAAERVGRPLGDAAWLRQLEEQTGRPLKAGKRGPKFRRDAN